jgi:hypothetical protein
MQFQEVVSSNIAAMAHDQTGMRVRFKTGAEYHYDAVPKALFDEILTAESVGRAFNQKVKADPKSFPYRQIVTGL